MTPSPRARRSIAVVALTGAVLALVATGVFVGAVLPGAGPAAAKNVHKHPLAEVVTNPCSLSARLAATVPSPTVGQPFLLVAQVSLGAHSPSYCLSGMSYHWNGLPAGCTAGNTPVAFCVPKVPGTFHPVVLVTTHYAMVIASTPLSVAA